MATNRTRRRRGHGSAAEAAAWEMVFDAGYDFFGELRDLGVVSVDAYGRVDPADAAEAWRRLGAHHLAGRKPDSHRPCWAVREFGFPPA